MSKLILLFSLTLAATFAHADDDKMSEGVSLDQVKCDSGQCFSSVKNVKATDNNERDVKVIDAVFKGSTLPLGDPNGALDI